MVSIQSEKTAELDGERVEVDRVDAALDHMASQAGLEEGFEVRVVRGAGYLLVAEPLAFVSLAVVFHSEHPDQRLIPASASIRP